MSAEYPRNSEYWICWLRLAAIHAQDYAKTATEYEIEEFLNGSDE